MPVIMFRLPSRLARRILPTRMREERGYVAVLTGLLMLVLVAFCAFAVDVGNWYLTGQRAQRAADAAALGGVPNLPGDLPAAYSDARSLAATNGFTDGSDSTTVTATLVGTSASRLRVDVSRTVNNIFGPLLGISTTTVSRSATADFAGPVEMGSPCNQYGTGSDPDGTSRTRADSCDAVQGNFWANVNGPASDKQNGDPYSAFTCSTWVAGRDGCSGSTNTDYDANGYLLTVDVKAAMPSLTVDLFDPVHVLVGNTCGYATGEPDVWGADATASNRAVNPFHRATGSPSDRYARVDAGDSNSGGWPWCTGDVLYYPGGNDQPINTRFTMRAPSSTSWDPLAGPVVCERTYSGYVGNLYDVLNEESTATYRADIAEHFRRWSTLCTIANPQVGEYTVQVTTSVGGAPENANGGNRYGIRAIGSSLNAVTVSGRERMGMYANKNGGVTNFHLARVPSSAAGSILKVTFYDVGDSNQSGRIRIDPPGGGNYSACTGTGVTTSIDADCSFEVTAGSPSIFNGRYQILNVPIPGTYVCDDTNPEACWVTLTYEYGSGSQPTDVTAWSASLEGDPIRLVE
jgi:Flp pilus assembly protein TadG